MSRASAQSRNEARSRVEVMRDRANTMPRIPAAGLSGSGDGENSKQCVSYQNDPRNHRPPSPQEIKKYRKSFQHEPGLRLVHVGSVEDKSPHPSYHRHGIRTVTGDRVLDCMQQVPDSHLQNYHTEQKEALYRSHVREPLGQSYSRGHVFPEQAQSSEFSFGQPSTISESAKGLIYYNEPLPDKRARSQAAKNMPLMNPEREITRQIDRNYDWKGAAIDPNTHRFGKVQPVLLNGVSASLKHADGTSIASRRQQQVRSFQHDRLGKAREVRGVLRNLGEDFVFGRVDNPDEWGVKKCITGEYSVNEQLPDEDLGLSTRKLSKIDLVPSNPDDRAYGIPSIRYDLPPPSLRSVADPQNYGNESNLKGLLYPSRFSVDGVEHEDFIMVRPREEIRELYRKLGAEFDDVQFARLCELAERDFGGLSADSFRHAWNKVRFDTTAPVLSPLNQQQSQFAGR